MRGSSSPTAIRIVVSEMPASCSAASDKLRVTRQRRADDHRVHLAERHLQAEGGFEAVEEALERMAGNAAAHLGVEVDREERRRQAQEHQALAQGVVLVALDG